MQQYELDRSQPFMQMVLFSLSWAAMTDDNLQWDKYRNNKVTSELNMFKIIEQPKNTHRQDPFVKGTNLRTQAGTADFIRLFQNYHLQKYPLKWLTEWATVMW